MSDPTLIVETSGRIGQVGLAINARVAKAITLDGAKRHARDLTNSIAELLQGEGLTPKELGRVFVSVGPGGYTGLRVGLMTAKAIAYTVGCPLVAVPTFAAIAEQAPSVNCVWVVADALQGQMYFQRYARTSPQENWRPECELEIVPARDHLPQLAAGSCVTGPGLIAFADLLPEVVATVELTDRTPRVESVYAVGCRLVPVTRDELMRLEPLYLRGSSAEEKAKSAT